VENILAEIIENIACPSCNLRNNHTGDCPYSMMRTGKLIFFVKIINTAPQFAENRE
jgi:hypothetical protein